MKKMTKWLLLATLILISNYDAFAQRGNGNIRSSMNEIVNDYGIPVIMGLLILGAAFGVVQNYDKIIDKDGNGTRKEGFLNLAYIIGYIVVGIAVIGAVVVAVSNLGNISF